MGRKCEIIFFPLAPDSTLFPPYGVEDAALLIPS